MTQDQIDVIKTAVVDMIGLSKDIGVLSAGPDDRLSERIQKERLNEQYMKLSAYLNSLRKTPLAPYQRDTIKANAWRDTRSGGYYDANEIISATERAHGIGEPPCEQPS